MQNIIHIKLKIYEYDYYSRLIFVPRSEAGLPIFDIFLIILKFILTWREFSNILNTN